MIGLQTIGVTAVGFIGTVYFDVMDNASYAQQLVALIIILLAFLTGCVVTVVEVLRH